MRVTPLADLVTRQLVIGRQHFSGTIAEDGGERHKIVQHYLRSPAADELIAIEVWELCGYTLQGEQPPFGLKLIGGYLGEPSSAIYSRSDCGPFWRGVAAIKYGALVARIWLKIQLFKSLRKNGMLAHPPSSKVISLDQLRLDWLFLFCAIASSELAWFCSRWLVLGNYSWSALCLVLSLLGWTATAARRNQLIKKRELERQETYLRQLFNRHSVTISSADFQRCLMGHIKPMAIITEYWYRQSREQLQSTHPCLYHCGSPLLPCAVHPNHQSEGKCNERCPDFVQAP